MWQTIKKVIKDCCTENNGTSYCPFRVSGFAFSAGACPTFTACAVWTTIQTGHMDYMAFGAGFASIMGGLALLAGGVAFKARTDTP
jgi:hypothetical protein